MRYHGSKSISLEIFCCIKFTKSCDNEIGPLVIQVKAHLFCLSSVGSDRPAGLMLSLYISIYSPCRVRFHWEPVFFMLGATGLRRGLGQW
jgi:hypothetical protein